MYCEVSYRGGGLVTNVTTVVLHCRRIRLYGQGAPCFMWMGVSNVVYKCRRFGRVHPLA